MLIYILAHFMLLVYKKERSFLTIMNIIDRDFLIRHGFTEDTGKKVLSGLFASNQKFKEVNITVSFVEPFMLLARSRRTNAAVDVNSIQDKRLILKGGIRCSTVVMNVLLDEIGSCMAKDYGNGLYEFIFEVRGLRYCLNITC